MSQLFSKIVQQCIMSEYGHLSEIDCLNLRGQVNLTLTGVQSAILKMIKEKWLVSKVGFICIFVELVLSNLDTPHSCLTSYEFKINNTGFELDKDCCVADSVFIIKTFQYISFLWRYMFLNEISIFTVTPIFKFDSLFNIFF